eukprot:TRINITY_DN8303_c0_g1_i1.p1 TRINITY_DN8303_c0_g1~~TRINITY_DN8303_c0_g1_i1.p1  ORF type:complete len:540 (-),score=118.78 TRINITY_DN8303_c0_g1_i1:623-2203(-)
MEERKSPSGKQQTGKRNAATRPTTTGGSDAPAAKTNVRPHGSGAPMREAETAENLHYEDPFEDDVEKDDIANTEQLEAEEDEDGDDGVEAGEGIDDDMEEEDKPSKRVFRPGVDSLGPDEVLDYDSSAYDMLHTLRTEWPCLSFDILVDKLGFERAQFPHTMYLVAGTQADQAQNNKIFVLKASQLHRTKNDDKDSDDEEEDADEDLDDDPIVEFQVVNHNGGINRIRSMPGHSEIVSTWADTGSVHIWNLAENIAALDAPPTQRLVPNKPPLQTFTGHASEGFAMDWSRTKEGRLLTGDCTRNIHLWELNTSTSQWGVSTSPYSAHTDSVEDLQWSPNEVEVFASCSVDKTIKIWDTRMRDRPGLSVQAHATDVNVISWNRKVHYLMLSGADDGQFSIWDLRSFKSNEPAAHFQWHKDAITSVAWHPTEESMLAVAGADNQITTWDMSLEKTEVDGDAASSSATSSTGGMQVDGAADIPPQLLFVHQGQTDIKELHWHPQIPEVIVSTAGDGFNIYKAANVGKLL